LAADALVGYLSAACCHMANVSHRLGKQLPPEAIGDAIKASPELTDAFERCSRYLRENSVELGVTPATLGPWVTFDPVQQHFVKEFEQAANELSRRHYREPFVVPKLT
jgi:hypothetical protein